MATISIDINRYTVRFNRLDMLLKYISEHQDFCCIPVSEDMEETRKALKTACSAIEDNSERDLVKRAIDHLFKKPFSVMSRQNLYRLFFVLRINCLKAGNDSAAVAEANNFLLNYMHEPELSARNLEEFIVICVLNLGLEWSDALELFFDKDISLIENHQLTMPALLQTYEGQTRDIFLYGAKLTSLEEVKRFILEHDSLFALIGNTHYFALFNDVYLYPVERDGLINYRMIDDLKSIQKKFSECGSTQMKDYYERLFGLYSLDDEPVKYRNHLQLATINTLTKILPDVFLTLDVFSDIVQRRRGKDIPCGVFLLHLLADLGEDAYVPASKNVSACVDAFVSQCDHYLNTAGYPILNPNIPIERLVVDIYREVIRTDGKASTKNRFLYFFRSALTAIARRYE